MDYTVIIKASVHFGDEASSLSGYFVGNSEDFDFDCPGIDPSQEAVITFQARQVDSAKNVFRINDNVVYGGLPRTAAQGWSAQTLLVNPGALKARGNVLHIESRTADGRTDGDIDDFVIDNLVLFYKTS
ncbi:hypothetical protein [Kocuria rosea]|uniref:hypothetical protein n=1 Tax=Kocuria rosea TaxID=1275 RepID=UPI000D641416|nr:hypothetical protein [Kocuria rosea]PWF82819.1 hypothetical protein DEJ37_14955 [Kocuria rosea]STX03554.1 Uncharacterised protein [Kocuria rosea]